MAILLVILYHYISMTPPAARGIVSYMQATFGMGWSGVNLFFVLSGFLIGGILLDARNSTHYFKTFYLRRVHRIMPIYYLWIGIYFLVAFTPLVRWVGSTGIVPARPSIIPIYGFFLQNTVWSRQDAFRTVWLSALWSLAVEEQFYLVVPSVVRLFSKRGLVMLLGLTVLAGPLVRILVFRYIVPTHPAAPYMLTPCCADALAMGVLLAVGWREESLKQWLQRNLRFVYAAVGLLSLGFAYLAITGKSQYSYAMSVWGFSCVDAFFAGLLVVALMAPRGIWAGICRWPFLTDVGGVSYCMYIIHASVNRVCHAFLSSSPDGISTLSSSLATLLAAIATWGLAKLSWRLLESPMIRRGHRYRY